jgi:hypothetical protein
MGREVVEEKERRKRNAPEHSYNLHAAFNPPSGNHAISPVANPPLLAVLKVKQLAHVDRPKER